MLSKDDLKFNLDWLQGVLKITDMQIVIDFLNSFPMIAFDNWIESCGLFNYAYGFSFAHLKGFKFCYNRRSMYQLTGDENYKYDEFEYRDSKNTGDVPSLGECNNPYIFFQVSGDAIRFLQEYDLIHNFLSFLYQNNFCCTRFDVNCDIFNQDNSIVPLIIEAADFFVNPVRGRVSFRGKYFRRNNKSIRIMQNYDDLQGKNTTNVAIGNHGSETAMFRCYNKRVEVFDTKPQKVAEGMWQAHGCPNYWYRLEYELHKKSAENIFNAYCEGYIFNNIGAFICAFDKFFDIVIHTTMKNNENKVSPIWQQFRALIDGLNIDFVQFGQMNETITHDAFISSVELDKEYLKKMIGVLDEFELLLLEPDFAKEVDRLRKLKIASGNEKYLSRIRRAEEHIALIA